MRWLPLPLPEAKKRYHPRVPREEVHENLIARGTDETA